MTDPTTRPVNLVVGEVYKFKLDHDHKYWLDAIYGGDTHVPSQGKLYFIREFGRIIPGVRIATHMLPEEIALKELTPLTSAEKDALWPGIE